MTVKPLWYQVLIKLDSQPEPPVNGIILLDDVTEKSRVVTGIITDVGEDVGKYSTDIEHKLKVGDKVYLSCFVGETMEIDGQKYQIVQEDDIYAYQPTGT